MSLAETLRDGLQPHANTLNSNLTLHGQNILGRLSENHDRIGDLGRPDTGDQYIRLAKTFTVPAGTYELGTVPAGEVWLVQSLVTNGIVHASPHFVLRSGGYLIASVIKEGIGTETQGGDIVCLQGEQVVFQCEAEGSFEFVLTVLRRKFPRLPRVPRNVKSEQLTKSNTHEPGRDVITEPSGPLLPSAPWPTSPPDMNSHDGNPPLVKG